MTRWLPGCVLALLVVACANTPPVPDWQMNAKGALERAHEAYLSGNNRVEAAEFARARSEVARSGRPDLLARLELSRCATRVASLVIEPCTAWAELDPDAAAPERAYAAYLAGQVLPRQVAQLPQQHRALALPGATVPVAALQAVADPLARLVAAGVLLQTGRADPGVIRLAIDTASAQGWRRPLLAWLGVQALRADAAGDSADAQRIRRRMALVSEGR
jgi:hypothetical protein